MAKTFPNVFPYADFVTFTMDKTLRGPQGGIIVYKACFHNIISNSIFPLSQGGPLQTIQFAKMIALVELSKINIKKYAETVQKYSRIICSSLIHHGIHVITGKTDTHIVLVDVSTMGTTGKIVEQKLYEHRILANRNLIPNDSRSPEITSGIRFGSICISNLNYSEEDVITLSQIISEIILSDSSNMYKIEYLINKYHKNINISS